MHTIVIRFHNNIFKNTELLYMFRTLLVHHQGVHSNTGSTVNTPNQVHNQNFSLGAADPEAIYNLCLFVKIML
jgi:hypothetical protein